jgi:hypothetical protein
MPKPIFDEALFRDAVTRWEVNADRASAERVLAGAGVVLRMLDQARANRDAFVEEIRDQNDQLEQLRALLRAHGIEVRQ